jgi:hypothetical protein
MSGQGHAGHGSFSHDGHMAKASSTLPDRPDKASDCGQNACAQGPSLASLEAAIGDIYTPSSQILSLQPSSLSLSPQLSGLFRPPRL